MLGNNILLSILLKLSGKFYSNLKRLFFKIQLK